MWLVGVCSGKIDFFVDVVMVEIGVDMSSYVFKIFDDFEELGFDLVVILVLEVYYKVFDMIWIDVVEVEYWLIMDLMFVIGFRE